MLLNSLFVFSLYQLLDLSTSEWGGSVFEQLGYGVILISCDWILRLIPLFSGRWEITQNFAENVTVPSFADSS